MDWRLKVGRQAVLARLPFGHGLRRAKRKLFGYQPDLGNLRSTLDCWAQMRQGLERTGGTIEGATVLEIGTGWFPTIPILQCLQGAKRVYMSDLNVHLDDVSFAATLDFLRQSYPDDARLRAIQSRADLPLTYLAPFDVSALPDGSIDLVTSRTVLEHIPPDVLLGLFKALRPKLSARGRMVHLVDHSDHLEHSDKAISKINFLTWPERKHAWVNQLTREGENRLRHHEYPDLFAKAGYRVTLEEAEVHEPTRQLAKSLPLQPHYAAMTAEQLATMSSLYVLAP
ncbi:class I SAM-dependent methyltransferase [Roseateles chitinivorans]|uniref:class I SAM-dependent methyltransferase n=1 Tax=Roseateles chitinivorans TaxID=2917965 RepID=UPI003D66C222